MNYKPLQAHSLDSTPAHAAGPHRGLLRNETDLFLPGTEGYPHYRIPSLILAGQALLAFAEGRKQRTDHGWVDIVMKRSLDAGLTWSPLSVVQSESEGTRQVSIGNPTPLYDDPQVALFFCRENKEILVTRSFDSGVSWSPVETIAWSRPAHWEWLAAGPPGALVTRTGRWMIPCDGFAGAKAFYSAKEVFSFVLYSDDKGVTWEQGPLLPGGNECQAAQLADGSLLLNMRSRDAKRLFSRSEDNGVSWSSPAASTPPIYDGNCQGSMISLHEGRTLLSTTVGAGRTRLSVHVSYDYGLKWKSTVINEDPCAYSSVVSLGDLEPPTVPTKSTSEVGILFETKPSAVSTGGSRVAAHQHSKAEHLRFARLSVEPFASSPASHRDEL
ncbi:hypothetical protein AB1Y20_022158 [Prymnesium parvum]|uniref:Sialidase domain-containing protein n=1 Tax=Prymnesium parvum TaxID=97485 RepID=A0AB34JII7_PRYPA